MEKPDPYFPFAPAFDLSDPTLRWHGARQLAANTSEVEVDWRAKWIRFARQAMVVNRKPQ